MLSPYRYTRPTRRFHLLPVILSVVITAELLLSLVLGHGIAFLWSGMVGVYVYYTTEGGTRV